MLSLDRQNAQREAYRAMRPSWQPATERFASLVRAHLTPESRILDLGCGRGGLVEQLGHPLAQMVGIDPDWASLREHRLPLPRAAARSEALPLASKRFDLVYASWVLEHVSDPLALLSAIERVLRPGGHFIFITPNKRHPLIALNRLLTRLGRWQTALVDRLYGRAAADTFPAYYRANDPAGLRHLATQCGFGVATLDAIPDPTYLAFNNSLFRAAIWLEEGVLRDRPVHLVGALHKRAGN